MTTPASAVPDTFHVVHLDLAREPGHPEGSVLDRYTLMLPLTLDGRVDADEARAYPEYCRVSRALGQDALKRGQIHRDDGGAWVFDFGDAEGEPEVAFRLAQERFEPVEYVSIQRAGEQHSYRVVSLQPV